MRVSVRKDDPGYDPILTLDCKVLVDGVDVTNRCYTADEEKGTAWCYKLNDEKQKFYDSVTDEAAQETLHGKVEIIVKQQNGTSS